MSSSNNNSRTTQEQWNPPKLVDLTKYLIQDYRSLDIEAMAGSNIFAVKGRVCDQVHEGIFITPNKIVCINPNVGQEKHCIMFLKDRVMLEFWSCRDPLKKDVDFKKDFKFLGRVVIEPLTEVTMPGYVNSIIVNKEPSKVAAQTDAAQ